MPGSYGFYGGPLDGQLVAVSGDPPPPVVYVAEPVPLPQTCYVTYRLGRCRDGAYAYACGPHLFPPEAPGEDAPPGAARMGPPELEAEPGLWLNELAP
jgi:hypothetical protein